MVSSTDGRALRVTLEHLFGALEQAGLKGAVIGGIAASVLGRERLTADVDAVTTISNDTIDVFLSAARDHSLEPRIENAEEFSRRNRILLLTDTSASVEVDASFAGLPFEFETIERARELPYEGLSVPVATAEDIIVMKMVAGREVDLEDVRRILGVQAQLDLARIRDYLKQFGEALEDDELALRFERELYRVRRD